jgi:phage tail sheath protein FI
MAEQIISPGVFANENDQSLYTQGPVAVGAAFVGPTVKGVPMVPTVVTSYSDYLSKFGDVFLPSGSTTYQEYLTSISVREYFNGGGQTALITRIVSGSSNYSTFSNATVLNALSKKASGSLSVYGAVIGTGSVYITGSGTTWNVQFTTASNPQSTGNTYYVQLNSNDTLNTVNLANTINANSTLFGVTAVTSSTYNLFLTSNLYSDQNYNINGNGTNLYTATISGSVVSASLAITGAADTASFTLETLTWGNIMNNWSTLVPGSYNVLSSGSVNNVKYEITAVNTGSGTFTLVVRRGDDADNNKNVLETWSNLSLDEQQPNYISRVIGDQKLVYTTDASGNGFLQLTGDYPNNSQYIRVKPGTVQKITNSILPTGVFNPSLTGSLPVLGNIKFGSFQGGVGATNRTSTFFENLTSTANDCQGFVAIDYTNAITLLANKDEFDFNLLVIPGVTLGSGPLSSVSDDAIALCETRTDSMAIVDTTSYNQTPQQAITAAASSTSNYAATYYPWVQVFSSNLGKAVWVPPSVVMAGVYAFNDQVSAEWFAPAGLNRGGIGSVIRAERKLSQSDRDNLYLANVNPLATFPGNGVVAFGQKTLQKRPTSLDRVNVRRLLISLKRFLSGVGRQLIFEQNTATTRNRFLSVAEPYMESIVQRQGLYSYKIVMDDSNNTPDVIDRNQLVGQIFVQPTKTAEFIILNFTVTPTGATF